MSSHYTYNSKEIKNKSIFIIFTIFATYDRLEMHRFITDKKRGDRGE
jgi:hypothetical protein